MNSGMTSFLENDLILRHSLTSDVKNLQACQERNLPERYPSVMWESFAADYAATSYVLLDATKDPKDSGSLIGFIVASTHQVLSFAVDEAYRKRGCGTKLMTAFLNTPNIRFPIALQVRTTNAPALALYKKVGFRDQRVLTDYYKSPPGDAILMHYSGDS